MIDLIDPLYRASKGGREVDVSLAPSTCDISAEFFFALNALRQKYSAYIDPHKGIAGKNIYLRNYKKVWIPRFFIHLCFVKNNALFSA